MLFFEHHLRSVYFLVYLSKWLIRKTSGSRSKFKSNGDYSDNRNSKKAGDFENLPQKESMRNKNYHNTYLDTTLVKRWLHSKVGQNFDDIYSEFLTRVQPKYLDEYRDCIYWYVEKKENVEMIKLVIKLILRILSIKCILGLIIVCN